eukprot:232923_1
MSNKQCFYCHEKYDSIIFIAHLKTCSKRSKNKTAINTVSQTKWICPMCSFNNNFSAQKCIMCQQGCNPNNQPPKQATWQCNSCTFVNSSGYTSCKICSTDRKHNTQTVESQSNFSIINIASIDQTAFDTCMLCHQHSAEQQLSCSHNVCGSCLKKHVLNTIVKKKCIQQTLLCPVEQCTNILSKHILKSCDISQYLLQEIDTLQHDHIKCPNCHMGQQKLPPTTYVFKPNEKGLDGKILSQIHQQHKNKFRYKCIYNKCNTIFCIVCKEIPYHIGYNCKEFDEYKSKYKCRFCEVVITDNRLETTIHSSIICNSTECVQKSKLICNVQFECGHFCIGLQQQSCFGCLNIKCVPKGAEISDEEYCCICWVDILSAAPTVKLNCGDYFHYSCLIEKIKRGFHAPRLTFGFLNCPLCRISMIEDRIWGYSKKMKIIMPRIVQYMVKECKLRKYIPNGIVLLIEIYLIIPNIIEKYVDLKNEVQIQARKIGYALGLNKDKRLSDPNSYCYNNYDKFVMNRFNFHLCFKCKNPYYGGWEGAREAGLEQNEIWKHEQLICGSCAKNNIHYACKKHGKKYLKYKCKYCCSVSVWFCWKTTHFCSKCYRKQESGDYLNRKPISELPKCPGKDKCALGIEHPPNGMYEYFIGCILCNLKGW